MSEQKPRIVVLGGGLGGVIAAYDLDEKMQNSAEITLVSDQPKFSFTPSNPWVAVGWREANAIQIDLDKALGRKKIGFVAQEALRVEPAKNQLLLADGSALSYDFLVIATGPDLAYDEIEGLGPGGHTVSICQTHHASAAAEAFEAFCADPKPIVVGAVQGASCFGPAYEFAMILDTELRRRKLRDKVPMTFVTPEPYIGHLGLDGVGDTKSMLESEMRSRHIKWITDARVDRVDEGAITISKMRPNDEPSSRQLPFGFAMLLPAFRGIPALMGIEGLVNPRGFVLVDEHQRNSAFPNIFALGVCIAIPPVGESLVPVGVPKTGFMIESMSAAIAQNVRAIILGYEPKAKASWNAICLADFGDDGVAFAAQPQIPPRNVNWSTQGRWVHFAKIAFEKFFLRKVRLGKSEPAYERLALKIMGVKKLERSASKPS
ncbi:FAD-dependent oxidoreductase [Altererythrobacter sp. ZODW24]|uniref:NAD(P)/FAD-dependent oxidoreductase n=1 Tax=Altererythrobacter sp. ZODW24 TaxID=2185142 RepID=UPI000DF74A43|nr:FAD-dependent oxidoreductase [Altererythrobacter sp. ZODW24]